MSGSVMARSSVGGTPAGISPQLWSSLVELLDATEVPSPAVLDCGGGSGSVAVPLAMRGCTVTVVDVSIDALGTLTRRAGEGGVADRVQAVQADAEALTGLFDPASFGLVLAHDVLDEVADPQAVFGVFRSLLASGGHLSVVTPNPVAAVLGRAIAGDLSGALAAADRAERGVLSVETVLEMAGSAGFTPVQVEGLSVFANYVPGIDLDRSGAVEQLDALERRFARRSPYRDIAARVHLLFATGR